MKFNRKKQTVAGFISVMVLGLVAGATFFSRYSQPKITADTQNISPLAGLTFSPPYQTVKTNQELELSINGDFSEQPIIGGTIVFSFDPAKLEVKSTDTQDLLLGKSTLEELDNRNGIVKLVFLPTVGADSSGVIAKIKFISKASGKTPLSFEETTGLTKPDLSVVLPSLAAGTISIED